jgi:hypothetical protein
MIRRSRKRMTISELKRAMDRRFDRVERAIDRLERTKVDKAEFRKATATSIEETRRHFDVVAEALRDDIRIFADGLASHTDRLEQHETRITKLERRSV